MKRLVALSSIVFLFLSALARPVHAADCFPACRAGFVCNPEGRCVSECNPPCEGGTACRAGQCVAPPKEEEASRSGEDRHFTALAGGALFVAGGETTPGIAAGFRYATSGDHAFVGGGRFMLGLPEGPDFAVLGVDAGYRGNFATGDVEAGIVALATPQIWVGGSAAMFFMGAAVGPFVHVGRLYIELPIGGGFGTLLKDPFKGRSRDLGGAVLIGLHAGVTF